MGQQDGQENRLDEQQNRAASMHFVLGVIFSILIILLGFIIASALNAGADAQTVSCGDSCASSIYETQEEIRNRARFILRGSIVTGLSFVCLSYFIYRKNHRPEVLHLP